MLFYLFIDVEWGKQKRINGNKEKKTAIMGIKSVQIKFKYKGIAQFNQNFEDQYILILNNVSPLYFQIKMLKFKKYIPFY